MGFLETAVRHWRKVLPLGSVLLVTVDGDEADCARAFAAFDRSKYGAVYRVGQVGPGIPDRIRYYDGKMGVAVNKNTGIELLMDHGVEHLFLCDDDTWPLNKLALDQHLGFPHPHSMVCWGDGRLQAKYETHAAWTWPRGVLLYTHRDVVLALGGMDERFGPGGHEHAEWSRRIHQAGYTPDPFLTPRVYAEVGTTGAATRASAFWHAEDMRQSGEHTNAHRWRRRKITSLRKEGRDWKHIEQIMVERDGNTDFVPFSAHENGRASATLCTTSTGLGAGGEQ